MAWYPEAVRKQLTVPRRSVPREPIRMSTPRRINLHTAVSGTKSLAWSGNTSKPSGSMGYFNTTSAGGVFSHFYVREDGTVEQMQDTAYRSACDLDGNPDTISVESWDGRRAVEWTPAQEAAIKKLVRWLFRTHPTIPAKLATSNRKGWDSWGLSWHRLGVPGYAAYSRASGGLIYTTARGKTCPGTPRINQIPGIFKAATSEVLSTPITQPTQPTPVHEEDIMAALTPSELATAIQQNTRLAMLGVLETGRYAEYIDQDGNEKRDVRPLSDIIFATHAAAVTAARDSAVTKGMIAKQAGLDPKEVARELADELRPDLRIVVSEMLADIELPESSPSLDELAETMIDKLAARLSNEV